MRDWEIGKRGALGWTPGVKLVEPTIANAPFFALYFKEKGKEKGQLRLLEGPISESKYTIQVLQQNILSSIKMH